MDIKNKKIKDKLHCSKRESKKDRKKEHQPGRKASGKKSLQRIKHETQQRNYK